MVQRNRNTGTKSVQDVRVKGVKELLPLARKWFNLYIRLRDTDEYGRGYCISSGKLLKINSVNCQAGHYFSAGKHPWLAFNEDNVHLQSKSDNYFQHGNLLPYRKNLIKKIGENAVKELEIIDGYFVNKQGTKDGFKWDRYGLMDIINTYREKCKRIKQTKMI